MMTLMVLWVVSGIVGYFLSGFLAWLEGCDIERRYLFWIIPSVAGGPLVLALSLFMSLVFVLESDFAKQVLIKGREQ